MLLYKASKVKKIPFLAERDLICCTLKLLRELRNKAVYQIEHFLDAIVG